MLDFLHKYTYDNMVRQWDHEQLRNNCALQSPGLSLPAATATAPANKGETVSSNLEEYFPYS